jgi:hypothetical protein
VAEPDGGYELRIRFRVPAEIIYDRSLVAGKPESAVWSAPGSLDAYVVDAKNYALMSEGEQFDAVVAEKRVSDGEMTVTVPTSGSDWYVVFSNLYRLSTTQVVDTLVDLYGEPAQQPMGLVFLPLAHNGPGPSER